MHVLFVVHGLVAESAWHAACKGQTLRDGLHGNQMLCWLLCLTMPAAMKGA